MHNFQAVIKNQPPIVNRPFLLITALIISALITLASTGTSANESFSDFKGNTSSIDAHLGKGKWLVVMLWASDCHICNQEAHQYVTFHQKHAAIDASVLGISLDGEEKKAAAETFIKKHNVSFPNLIGEPAHVAQMYERLTGSSWLGTPSFMVYTPGGELLGAQAGAIPPKLIESFIERESAAQTDS